MKKIQFLALLLLCHIMSVQQEPSSILVTRQAPEKTLLVKNALVFDGSGKEPMKGFDILIEKGIIKKIGKNLKTRAKARVIDATGKTVLPGLIDMHGHLFAFGATQAEAYPPLYLAGGVTTIFTPGEFEPELILELRDSIRKGLRAGPDIFSAGPYFNSRPAFAWMNPVNSVDSTTMLFEKWQDRIDGIKVYASIKKDQFDKLMQLARKQRLPVTGHLVSISTKYAVEQGISGLEHGLPCIIDFGGDYSTYPATICSAGEVDLSRPEVDSLIKLIVSRKVYMDPTMIVLDQLSSNFKPVVPNLEFYLDNVSIYAVQQQRSQKNVWIKDSCLKKALKNQFIFNRRFFQQGGMLVASTDPGTPEILPGFGIKREIILFLQSGISLPQAIRIASLNGAIALGIDKKTGSIERGKRADLSIIDGDITTDINLLSETELVIKDGVLYKTSDLLQSAKNKVRAGLWKKRSHL